MWQYLGARWKYSRLTELRWRATCGMLRAWIRLFVTQAGGLPMDRDVLINQMEERFREEFAKVLDALDHAPDG